MSADAELTGLKQWLPTFVAQERDPENVAQWVTRTTTAILEEVPEIARVEGLAVSIEETVRDHWLAFLDELVKPQFTFHLVDRGHAIAVEVARSQLSLETLIRFYRVGQQSTWAYVSGLVGSLPADEFDHAEALIYMWDRASTWIDRAITASIEVYQAERSRVQAGAAAQRYELVRAVLAGELDDAREISAGLGGYPVSTVHTALVLTCADHEHVGQLEQIAQQLAASVGSSHPLLVRPGGRRLWAWIATRTEPDQQAIVDAFAAADRPETVVAIGSAASGVPGFIQSHTEAAGALGVSSRSAGSRIVRYDDVELLVLLGCTPDVDRFVRRTLGDLAGDDEGSRRIRETVVAFLETGGNADEAARRLTVHRNTIRYRLGQAEEALQRPVTKISPELAIALRHHEAFHDDGA